MGSLSVYIVYDCTLDFTEFISQLEIRQNKVSVCFILVCNDYYGVIRRETVTMTIISIFLFHVLLKSSILLATYYFTTVFVTTPLPSDCLSHF